MSKDRLRQRIAWEAARLIYGRQESLYHKARAQAARTLASGTLASWQLPTNREIREQVLLFAEEFSAGRGSERLRDYRLELLRALRAMRRLDPRIGREALVDHDGEPATVELTLAAGTLDEAIAALDGAGFTVSVLSRPSGANGAPEGTTLQLRGRLPLRIQVQSLAGGSADARSARSDASVTIGEFEQYLLGEYPEMEVTDSLLEDKTTLDCFERYRALLASLEQVKQNPEKHPEGDALYHSLQVFALARDELPYDEEFLVAALLHDVGKAIDPQDHVAAALEALDGCITERTAWLIEHHSAANALRDGKLGVRGRRRLEESESYEELMLLSKCDRAGRQVGVQTPDVDDALEYLRELAETCGE